MKWWRCLKRLIENKKVQPSSGSNTTDNNIEKSTEMNTIDIGKIPAQKTVTEETSIEHVYTIDQHESQPPVVAISEELKPNIIMETPKIQAKVIAGSTQVELEQNLNEFLMSLSSATDIISTNFTGNRQNGLYMTILYRPQIERV